jgi:single-stranded DNA-specific DHH superfamily exonuclease
VRRNAAEALGNLGDARAVTPLITALKDIYTCSNAAVALGELGDANALPHLNKLKNSFATKPKIVRDAAAEAISKINAKSTRALVQKP